MQIEQGDCVNLDHRLAVVTAVHDDVGYGQFVTAVTLKEQTALFHDTVENPFIRNISLVHTKWRLNSMVIVEGMACASTRHMNGLVGKVVGQPRKDVPGGDVPLREHPSFVMKPRGAPAKLVLAVKFDELHTKKVKLIEPRFLQLASELSKHLIGQLSDLAKQLAEPVAGEQIGEVPLTTPAAKPADPSAVAFGPPQILHLVAKDSAPANEAELCKALDSPSIAPPLVEAEKLIQDGRESHLGQEVSDALNLGRQVGVVLARSVLQVEAQAEDVFDPVAAADRAQMESDDERSFDPVEAAECDIGRMFEYMISAISCWTIGSVKCQVSVQGRGLSTMQLKSSILVTARLAALIAPGTPAAAVLWRVALEASDPHAASVGKFVACVIQRLLCSPKLQNHTKALGDIQDNEKLKAHQKELNEHEQHAINVDDFEAAGKTHKELQTIEAQWVHNTEASAASELFGGESSESAPAVTDSVPFGGPPQAGAVSELFGGSDDKDASGFFGAQMAPEGQTATISGPPSAPQQVSDPFAGGEDSGADFFAAETPAPEISAQTQPPPFHAPQTDTNQVSELFGGGDDSSAAGFFGEGAAPTAAFSAQTQPPFQASPEAGQAAVAKAPTPARRATSAPALDSRSRTRGRPFIMTDEQQQDLLTAWNEVQTIKAMLADPDSLMENRELEARFLRRHPEVMCDGKALRKRVLRVLDRQQDRHELTRDLGSSMDEASLQT